MHLPAPPGAIHAGYAGYTHHIIFHLYFDNGILARNEEVGMSWNLVVGQVQIVGKRRDALLHHDDN